MKNNNSTYILNELYVKEFTRIWKHYMLKSFVKFENSIFI